MDYFILFSMVSINTFDRFFFVLYETEDNNEDKEIIKERDSHFVDYSLIAIPKIN